MCIRMRVGRLEGKGKRQPVCLSRFKSTSIPQQAGALVADNLEKEGQARAAGVSSPEGER